MNQNTKIHIPESEISIWMENYPKIERNKLCKEKTEFIFIVRPGRLKSPKKFQKRLKS